MNTHLRIHNICFLWRYGENYYTGILKYSSLTSPEAPANLQLFKVMAFRLSCFEIATDMKKTALNVKIL